MPEVKFPGTGQGLDSDRPGKSAWAIIAVTVMLTVALGAWQVAKATVKRAKDQAEVAVRRVD